MWRLIFSVFIGSGLGGVCRFLATKGIEKLVSSGGGSSFTSIFPWGTLAVNISGCFIIGLIFGLSEKGFELSPETKTFLTAGFCGGLTTFSTFSHENLLLFNSGNFGVTLIYATVSLVLGFLAAWLGHAIIRF